MEFLAVSGSLITITLIDHDLFEMRQKKSCSKRNSLYVFKFYG
jgi:hypothetical protein